MPIDSEEVIEITPDTIAVPESERNRCDIEASFSYFNPFFLFLGTALITVFAVQVANGLFTMGDAVDLGNFTYRYANYRTGGNPWGIVTSVFLHGSVEHLFGNLLFLYIFSLISYRIVGFWKSLAIFLVTGIFGGVASFYFGSLPSIGASGAIFGMFGFVSAFYLLKRDCLSENLQDLSWVMAGSAVLQILSGFSVPYVDNFAHLGGFVSGCIGGYFYFSGREENFAHKKDQEKA
jgi:rhomboid protease GluP